EVAGAKPAAEAEQPAKEDAEEAAAGLVVRTYNEVLGNVERSLVNPYLTQVGEQLPPVEKMQHVTLGSLGGPWDRMLDEAKQALGEARAAAPQLPLIAEADALLARTRELGEAYRAVAQYFSAGTYKTDKGAGAGPVHDKLIQALDAYAEAQGKVAMALELREQEMLR